MLRGARVPRCTDRCPGASNLGLLEYRSILYPCINQLVIVCVEIFAQKECYIDDAANILSTAIESGGGSWALIWQYLLGGRIYRPKPPVRPWTKEHEVPIDTPNPWFWGYGHPGGRTMECNQRFFRGLARAYPRTGFQ